jgi:hypothetical protein
VQSCTSQAREEGGDCELRDADCEYIHDGGCIHFLQVPIRSAESHRGLKEQRRIGSAPFGSRPRLPEG